MLHAIPPDHAGGGDDGYGMAQGEREGGRADDNIGNCTSTNNNADNR